MIKRERSAPLAYYHLRLKNRAILIEANITIRERKKNWLKETNKLLSAIYKSEPEYYYATATLAQVQFTQKASQAARESFRKAHDIIDHSGDIHTVMEVRSKILLLMVAGMCCKHGLSDEKRAVGYLDKADELRGDLPKIDTQVCTVFSALSKQNETSSAILEHIKLIREGKVLVG